MESSTLLWLALLVLVVAVSSPWFARLSLTAPLLLLAGGALIGPTRLGWGAGPPPDWVRLLLEASLALLVFTSGVKAGRSSPALRTGVARMALLATPLTVGLGVLAGALLWPTVPLSDLLLLAALCAATDPEVARPFMEHRRVPERLKQLLDGESGLADGLIASFVWLSFTGAQGDFVPGEGAYAVELIREVLFAVAIGGAIGWGAGRLLSAEALDQEAPRVALFAVAILAWGVAERAGGSGVTAVFVAGLAVARGSPGLSRRAVDFASEEGRLLLFAVFALAGATLVPRAISDGSLATVVWALLSLTVLRMLPVWLALWGTQAGTREKLTAGFMGPRGLPSLVLALVWIDETQRSLAPAVIGAVSLLVASSVLVHGTLARPIARRVSRHSRREGPLDQDRPATT